MTLALLRAVFGSDLECTRCGSPDVHPMQGAFGPLIGLVGLMRYGCRGCRRPFWIRTGAGRDGGRKKGRGETPPPEPRPQAQTRPAPLKIDFEVPPRRAEKVGLTALDADFEKLRRTPDDTKEPDPNGKKNGQKLFRF